MFYLFLLLLCHKNKKITIYENEEKIFDFVKDGITEGAVQLVKFDDQLRLSVIKIGSAYFCKKLAPSEILEIEAEINAE